MCDTTDIHLPVCTAINGLQELRSFRPNSKSFRPNSKLFLPNLKLFRSNLKLFSPIQNKTSTGQLMSDVLWNQKSLNVCKIQINMIPGGERINHIVRV